jgi:hypothetical protein
MDGFGRFSQILGWFWSNVGQTNEVKIFDVFKF